MVIFRRGYEGSVLGTRIPARYSRRCLDSQQTASQRSPFFARIALAMSFTVHSFPRFARLNLLLSAVFFSLGACTADPEPGSELDAGPDAGGDPHEELCPDGPAEPLVVNPPSTCSAAGNGETFFRLTALRLPGSSEIVGFDLDDHHTNESDDPIGCGIADEIADCRYGVDNKLPSILRILRTASSSFNRLQDIIDEALDEGSIDLRVALRGYDGVGDDEALLTLYLNGEIAEGIEDHCVGVNPDGSIAARLDRLPIQIPPIPVSGQDVSMRLDLSNIKLLITPPSEEGVAAALLGGAALWDDGEGGGLRTTAEALVERLLPSILPTLPSIMTGLLDMGEPGDCNAISVGLNAEFTRMDELGLNGDDG